MVFSLALVCGQRRGAPPVQPTSEDLAKIREKCDRIGAVVRDLKAHKVNQDLVADVEVYAKAGRFLMEFPELTITQAAIDHAMAVLDQGIVRAKQLSDGAAPWNEGKKQIHAYYSEIDGSVQPYAVTLPENYDPAKPARLYVWMHGRSNNATETEFLFAQQTFRPGNPPVADQGQIQLDLFGRINSAGWHWAGEADVFEAIQAVESASKSIASVFCCAASPWAAKERGTSPCIIPTGSPPPRSARAPGRVDRRRPASNHINTPR